MNTTNNPRSHAKPQVVIYLRTATSDQLQPGSPSQLSEQLNACLRKMTDLGTNSATVFVDYGKSGLGVNRSDLQNMLRYLAENRTDHVIVKDLSRLSRDSAETLQICRQIEEAGANLESLDDPDGKLAHLLHDDIARIIGGLPL